MTGVDIATRGTGRRLCTQRAGTALHHNDTREERQGAALLVCSQTQGTTLWYVPMFVYALRQGGMQDADGVLTGCMAGMACPVPSPLQRCQASSCASLFSQSQSCPPCPYQQ